MTALVFREGHDELGAEVVLTDPDGVRRPPVRMTKHPRRAGPLRRLGAPGRRGRLDLRGPGLERPARHLAARRRAQDPRRRRRRADVHRGRLLLERVGPRRPRPRTLTGRARRRRDQGARATPPRPVAGPPRRLQSAELRRSSPPTRCATCSASRAPTRSSPTGARSSAAGTSSSRARRARPSTRRPARSLAAPSAPPPKRLDAVAAMGFDVIYLPPIHPIGEVNRKGRNNTLTPAPDDVGSPWAIGSKEGGHDAIHPDLGTFEDFDAFVARARELGLEVALDFALQAAPDHPWVTSTRSGSPPAPTAPSPTPRTRRRSTRTSTRSTSTTTPTASTGRSLRVAPALDGARRPDLPRRQPAHQAGRVLGVAARPRSARTDPDVLFLSEAFTRPADDARARRGRLPPELHVLHLAQRQVRAREYLTRSRTSPATDAAELLRQHPRHPARATSSTAARRRSRSAPRSRPSARPSWGVYAGYELFEHVAVKPGSEEYLDSEKYQIRIRDWDAADGGGPHARAVPHQAQRDPPRAPRAPAAAQHRDPLQRRRAVLVFTKRHAPTGRRGHRHRGRQHRPARHPRDHGPPRPAGARPGLGRHVRGPRRDHRPGLAAGVQHNYVRLDPGLRARPRAHRRRHRDGEIPKLDPGPTGRIAEPRGHRQPDWFKTAVFYEVLVRSFSDSNGDGVGDFGA